jgi:hypothetical protein
MDIVELMHALERAWGHALPGHEAAERDAVLRELQRRLLETHERAPRPRAAIRLRLVRD